MLLHYAQRGAPAPLLMGNADAPHSTSASLSPEQKILSPFPPVGGGNFCFGGATQKQYFG